MSYNKSELAEVFSDSIDPCYFSLAPPGRAPSPVLGVHGGQHVYCNRNDAAHVIGVIGATTYLDVLRAYIIPDVTRCINAGDSIVIAQPPGSHLADRVLSDFLESKGYKIHRFHDSFSSWPWFPLSEPYIPGKPLYTGVSAVLKAAASSALKIMGRNDANYAFITEQMLLAAMDLLTITDRPITPKAIKELLADTVTNVSKAIHQAILCSSHPESELKSLANHAEVFLNASRLIQENAIFLASYAAELMSKYTFASGQMELDMLTTKKIAIFISRDTPQAENFMSSAFISAVCEAACAHREKYISIPDVNLHLFIQDLAGYPCIPELYTLMNRFKQSAAVQALVGIPANLAPLVSIYGRTDILRILRLFNPLLILSVSKRTGFTSAGLVTELCSACPGVEAEDITPALLNSKPPDQVLVLSPGLRPVIIKGITTIPTKTKRKKRRKNHYGNQEN